MDADQAAIGEDTDMSGFAQDWHTIDSLLGELLDLDDAPREARLAQLEGVRPDLAERLRRMLGSVDKGVALESLAASPLCSEALSRLSGLGPGDRLGEWTLRKSIGRGGMAEVFEGEREVAGTRQRAAIKLMAQSGFDPLRQQRFQRETSILARLADPRLARLFDAGVTADGRHWLAMEYIDGEPIDRACDRLQLSVTERVRLVIEIALAVDYAHRQLIVHRDLKPDNVLLSADGRVHVVDFGIARILQGDGDAIEVDATATQLRAYTLRFASPEQLSGAVAGVASDVYQLALLLHLLVTGTRPFVSADDDPARLLHAIREGVALPSRHVRALAAERAATLGSTPRRLERALRGDLDSILLHALEPDPARRYPGAREFADDLQRWLDDRPIRARGYSRAHRAARYLRRHWLGASALALIAVLLVGYTVTATRQAQQARIYAERSDRILDAMTEIFAPANPYIASPGSTTVAEALRRASDRFQNDELGDPEFQVRMLLRLVDMLVVAEQFEEVLTLAQRAESIATAHALDPALRAQAQVQTVAALQALGRYDEVLARVETDSAALPEADRQRLQYYVATIRSARGDYRGAIDLLEPLAPRLLVVDAAFRSDMLAALAVAYGSLGDFERARVLLVEARDMLDPDEPAHLPALLRRRSEIGNALGRLLRFEEAVNEYEDMLDFVHAQLGSTHPTAAKITTWAAFWLMMDERFEDAFLLFERLPPDVLTEEPFQRANHLEAKAFAALYSGRWEQALLLMLEAAELAQSTLGENAAQLSYFATQLAWLLFEFEEWDLAAAAAEQGHALSRGRRLLNGLLLQLLAEHGHALPGWPVPEFLATLPEGCRRIHGEALQAVLADHALPDRSILTDCLPDVRSRLFALGLPLGEATRSPRAQAMRSPLTERWRARRGQIASVTLPVLDERTRERFAAVIAGLSSQPRVETP